jgi:hypothetical protein
VLYSTNANDGLADDDLADDCLANDRLAEGKVFILFLVRKLYLYDSVLLDFVLYGLVFQHMWLSLFFLPVLFVKGLF